MRARERFARLATDLTVRSPALWPLLRGRVAKLFDALAPEWDAGRSTDSLASLEAALDLLESPPRQALDLGTGTGSAALVVARRWTETRVVGVDLSSRMVAAAREKVTAELRDRVSFEVGDAAVLPYPDGHFDLVVLANVIPFFDELARVLRPGGHVAFSFSRGSATPIYVPPERLQRELERRGFDAFAEVAAGTGTGLLARRAEPR